VCCAMRVLKCWLERCSASGAVRSVLTEWARFWSARRMSPARAELITARENLDGRASRGGQPAPDRAGRMEGR
jgi:hypothetical protein